MKKQVRISFFPSFLVVNGACGEKQEAFFCFCGEKHLLVSKLGFRFVKYNRKSFNLSDLYLTLHLQSEIPLPQMSVVSKALLPT